MTQRGEQDRGPARRRGSRTIAGADRMTDPHRAGRSESERNHEGDTGHVERDLVRRARDRIEHARHRGGEREHADFRGHLRRRGQPKRQQPPQPRMPRTRDRHATSRPPSPCIRSSRASRGPLAIDPPHREQQRRQHVGARDHRGPRRSRHAERRKAVVSVDQHPIAGGVDQVCGDEREHHRHGRVHALQVAAAHRVAEQERRAQDQHAEVRLEQRPDGAVKAEPRDGEPDQHAAAS